MKENIQEIQELYKDEERQEGRIEDEEVILIKPYEASTATSSLTSQMSFITEEVENLSKYMKFIQTPYCSNPKESKILHFGKRWQLHL